MNLAAARGSPATGDTTPGQGKPAAPLLGIGAAAVRAGVSERALRYYQEIGLLTPCACTPGGMRRYSEEDLARVARIKQLQTLLGFNLDEIAIVLRSDDRIAEIREAYHSQHTSDARRRELVRESLRLQLELKATVEAKLLAVDGFLVDLNARITRTGDVLAEIDRLADGHSG